MAHSGIDVEVTVPAAWAGKTLALNLGPIDDGDTTYYNGTEVGHMDVTTPNDWNIPRQYSIPADLVKAGRAVISIRVTRPARRGRPRGYRLTK